MVRIRPAAKVTSNYVRASQSASRCYIDSTGDSAGDGWEKWWIPRLKSLWLDVDRCQHARSRRATSETARSRQALRAQPGRACTPAPDARGRGSAPDPRRSTGARLDRRPKLAPPARGLVHLDAARPTDDAWDGDRTATGRQVHWESPQRARRQAPACLARTASRTTLACGHRRRRSRGDCRWHGHLPVAAADEAAGQRLRRGRLPSGSGQDSWRREAARGCTRLDAQGGQPHPSGGVASDWTAIGKAARLPSGTQPDESIGDPTAHQIVSRADVAKPGSDNHAARHEPEAIAIADVVADIESCSGVGPGQLHACAPAPAQFSGQVHYRQHRHDGSQRLGAGRGAAQ